jgi:hypothetical protein
MCFPAGSKQEADLLYFGAPAAMEATLAVAELLRRNGARIGHLGNYIGLFEFALFCYHWTVNVTMHLAGSSFDVVQRVLPDGAEPHRARVAAGPRPGPYHVAWCRFAGDALLLSRCEPHMVNHFVMLMPVVDECMTVDLETENLDEWADTHGFVLLETVADGNCGIHCMSSILGMPHTLASWQQLRRRLQGLHNELCGNLMWQTGFMLSGELPPTKGEAKSSKVHCVPLPPVASRVCSPPGFSACDATDKATGGKTLCPGRCRQQWWRSPICWEEPW